MIRVSVTTLEQFRRVCDTAYATEDDLALSIRGTPPAPSWQMEAGSAWQEALAARHPREPMCRRKRAVGNYYALESVAQQAAAEMAERCHPDIKPFLCPVCACWHLGKPNGTEGDDLVRVGDYTFAYRAVLDAREHIGPCLSEVKATRRWDGVLVVAQVDHAAGLVLQENKAKFSDIDPVDYEPSLQWRFYLAVHGAAVLRYNLFAFDDPKDGSYCRLDEIYSFRLWPYEGMEADCRRWLGRFLEWADRWQLIPFLNRQGSSPELEAA